jgi:hypothetical protein
MFRAATGLPEMLRQAMLLCLALQGSLDALPLSLTTFSFSPAKTLAVTVGQAEIARGEAYRPPPGI